MTDKRTTVVLDEQDQQALQELTALLRSSEMEAIRRSIRLARKVMQCDQEGGEIILKRGRVEQRLIFA